MEISMASLQAVNASYKQLPWIVLPAMTLIKTKGEIPHTLIKNAWNVIIQILLFVPLKPLS